MRTRKRLESRTLFSSGLSDFSNTDRGTYRGFVRKVGGQNGMLFSSGLSDFSNSDGGTYRVLVRKVGGWFLSLADASG